MMCLHVYLHDSIWVCKDITFWFTVSSPVTSKCLTYRKCSICSMTKLLIPWSICVGNCDSSSFDSEMGIPTTGWKIHGMLRSCHYSWNMSWAQQLNGDQSSLKSFKSFEQLLQKRLLKVTLTYWVQRKHCFWLLSHYLGIVEWVRNLMTYLHSAL